MVDHVVFRLRLSEELCASWMLFTQLPSSMI